MSAFSIKKLIDPLLQRSDVRFLMELLNQDGEETRLIGGAVRDSLFQKTVSDIDLTTTMLPDAVIKYAEQQGLRVVPTGLSHGTVTVVVDKEPFEVTTLREDVATDGRHAKIRFSKSFQADAERRDFTINALSLSQDGTIYDYCGGLKHIQEKKVCFIGNAQKRIQEDYLRILRFFRFTSNYATNINDEGLKACIQEKEGLKKLSYERIRMELLKIFISRHTAEILNVLSDTGLYSYILGNVAQIKRLERCIQNEEDEKIPPDALRRLTSCAIFVEEDAKRLCEMLRLSNHEEERLVKNAQMQEKIANLSKNKAGKIKFDRIFLRQCFALDKAEHFENSAFFDLWMIFNNDTLHEFTDDGYLQWKSFKAGQEKKPIFPLLGRDILEFIPAGPKVGKILNKVFNYWLSIGCPIGNNIRENLLEYAREFSLNKVNK